MENVDLKQVLKSYFLMIFLPLLITIFCWNLWLDQEQDLIWIRICKAGCVCMKGTLAL